MYTNQQRLAYAQLMKDVNSEQFERVGTQDWTPVTSLSQGTSSAQDVQLYQHQDQYVFAIQDMDLIEDFEWDDLQQEDSLRDAKVLAFVHAGEFPSEFVRSIEFVYQTIHKLNIDPEKITFVGAGIGGAHAQMLAHTFGGNLFTHDAPPVAKMLDGEVLLPGSTYQTTLNRMHIDPPGPNIAENIVEKWSSMSEGSEIFTHEDYIGSVKEIDSVSNLLPVISWGSEKIADLLSDMSDRNNQSGLAHQNTKDSSMIASAMPSAPKGGNGYVKFAEVGFEALSYGTAIYDTVKEGGSHDLDVFVNYLSDVSMSQEHIEDLVMQTYQMYGMPIDAKVEFELIALAQDMFKQQESLMFLSYNQMVDTIDYKLSEIMLGQGLDPTLLQQRPVHDFVNRLETPINYALAKLDEFSDQSSILAYLEQRILGSEIKPDFESYAVVKSLDDFLRRELGSNVDELNQGLIDAANTVDFYIDEMAEFAGQTMESIGEEIKTGLTGFTDLVGQVYNRFENYLESQASQLQETVQFNFQQIAEKVENLLPALTEQSQVIYEIDDLLEEYNQTTTDAISSSPAMNQLYKVISDYLDAWPELKARLMEPTTSSPELVTLMQQLDQLSNSVNTTQGLLNETATQIDVATTSEAQPAETLNLAKAMTALSGKLASISDDILTLQTALNETAQPVEKAELNKGSSASQTTDEHRTKHSQELRQ